MAVNPQTTTNTGALLREQVAAILVQPLEAASVVLAAGPRIFDTASPLRIPKLTGSTDPSWVAEGGLIPESEVSFDEIALMPTTRKSIKVMCRFTNELARQSVVGLDATLRARLVADVARKLDTALLVGTGKDTGGTADDSVTGIVNQAGVSTGDLDATDPDSLLDALGTAAANEVTPNRWFLSSADFQTLRKVKRGTGDRQYVLEPNLAAGAGYMLFGVPVTVTNKLPTGTAVLADMGQVAVARDLNPSVTLLAERYAEYDEQAIRVVCRYDLGLLHPEGVVVLTAAAGG